MRDIVLKNHKKSHDYAPGFYSVFKICLGHYFDSITGFDIVKFDDEVTKSAPNESTKDAVLSKYGQEGVDIIVRLLA